MAEGSVWRKLGVLGNKPLDLLALLKDEGGEAGLGDDRSGLGWKIGNRIAFGFSMPRLEFLFSLKLTAFWISLLSRISTCCSR